MPPMISTISAVSSRGYGEFLPIRPITPTVTTPWLARIGVFSGGTSNFSSRIAVNTTTGDFYIGGRDIAQVSPTLWGMALSKYSSTGQILWQKVMGAFNVFASVIDCCVDSAGDVYFVGAAQYTSGQPAGYTGGSGLDGYFGKLSSANGSVIFLKRFSFMIGSNSWTDSLEGIAYSSADNTIVITGKTPRQTGASSGVQDSCYVAKYNTSGGLVWQNVFWQTNAITGTGVNVDSSGIIYISATASTAAGNAILSLNSNGSLRWSYGLLFPGGGGNLYPYRVVTTSSGNMALAQYGSNTQSFTTVYVVVVTLLNSSGTKVWQTAIDNNRGSSSYPTIASSQTAVPPSINPINLLGIARDSSDNIYVAVCGRSSAVTDSILVYKFRAADGVVLWIREIYAGVSGTIGNQLWARPTGLACVGNYLYILGTINVETTTVANTSDGNYLFAKLPIDGTVTNTVGYTISTGIVYVINDVAAFHPLRTTVSSSSVSYASNTFSNVYSYSANTMTDVALTSNNLNFVIETKTL